MCWSAVSTAEVPPGPSSVPIRKRGACGEGAAVLCSAPSLGRSPLDLPLRIVRAAEIRDAKLRDQAMRAAKSAALNIAEAAGRVSRADRARVFAIARGEAMEAAAAVEIAVLSGDAAGHAY